MSNVTNIQKLTILSLLTMGLAACGQTPGSTATAGDRSATSNSKAGGTSTTGSSALLAGGDPQAVVTNARQSLLNQKAYRVRRMKIKTTKTYEYDPSIKIEAPIP